MKELSKNTKIEKGVRLGSVSSLTIYLEDLWGSIIGEQHKIHGWHCIGDKFRRETLRQGNNGKQQVKDIF